MNTKTSNKPERDDTSYYDEIFKQIRSKDDLDFTKDDDENNDIIYTNVVDQLKQNDKEIRTFLKSYFIDYFVLNSKLVHLNEILQLVFDQDLSEYLSDIKLSRSVETCLLCVGEKILNHPNGDDLKASLKKSLKKLGNFFEENFITILNDQYGVYPLRTFIRIISSNANDEFDVKQLLQNKSTSNITLKKKQQRHFNDNDETNDAKFKIKVTNVKEVPWEWKLHKFLKKFYLLIGDQSNILELALIAHISPCLTLLMRKLKSNEIYEGTCDTYTDLIDNQFRKKSNSFQTMIQDSVGSRFIETFLFCSTVNTKLYYINECLIPNLVKYARHIYANYPIQTLLKSIRIDDKELKILYDALLENMEPIVDLQTDHTFKHFILIELIETCKRNSYDSKKLTKALRNLFGCNDKENQIDFLRLLLVFQKYEEVTKEYSIKETLYMYDVKPIACTISNKLIEQNDKNVLECLNDLNANELEHLSTNNIGSHFIQDCLNYFYKSKQFDQIIGVFTKLKGRFLNICCNRSGSFVMETLWSITSIQQKIEICDELKDNELDLKRDQYARFFAMKTGMNFFKRKQAEWVQLQKADMKKRQMFSELYENFEEPNKANDNKRKNNNNNFNRGFNKNKRKKN